MAYNAKSSASGKGRARCFTTIIYPESAPTDWQQRLRDLNVKAVVSPLHDQDLTEEGQQKKAHWHLMIVYGTVKTMDQAQEDFQQLGGVGCEKVRDIRQMCRYFCHLDDPSKHQYQTDGLQTFGGIDVHDYLVTDADEIGAMKEMTKYIFTNRVQNFAEFSVWCVENNETWFWLLCTKASYYIDRLIKANRYVDDDDDGDDD